MTRTLKIIFGLTLLFSVSCTAPSDKNKNIDNSNTIAPPIPTSASDPSPSYRLDPSDLFIEMVNYLDSLGYSFDTSRIKKVKYFSNENAFLYDTKYFYHVILRNHQVFHLVGFTNNYDGIDTSKIKKQFFYAVNNIYGYFYCDKKRTNETLRDGVIEEWQFQTEAEADSAGRELNRIKNLAFFYTTSFVTRTKNNVYVFHNRGAFDGVHKKTIKRFNGQFDAKYPWTIPNSDKIAK